MGSWTTRKCCFRSLPRDPYPSHRLHWSFVRLIQLIEFIIKEEILLVLGLNYFIIGMGNDPLQVHEYAIWLWYHFIEFLVPPIICVLLIHYL